jgi:hypothetical protein
MSENRQVTQQTLQAHREPNLLVPGGARAIRTLPVVGRSGA